MAYSSGGTIQAVDYNGLASTNSANIAWVMGTGFGATGYGQSTSLISSVSASSTVTAVQWAGLLYLLNRGLAHQGGTQIAAGNLNAVAGGTITAFANVSTAVTTINTNKALFGSQGTTTTGTPYTSWNPTATEGTASVLGTEFSGFLDCNVTWSTAEQARFFFNCGGQLNFVASATVNGSSRNQAVANAVNALGGMSAFRNTTNGGRSGTGGTITVNNTSFGYRNAVFGSATELIRSTQASPYGSDYCTLSVFSQENTTTNGANGASLVFRFLIYSAADYQNSILNLATSFRMDVVPPESTYLTASWSIPTISWDNT